MELQTYQKRTWANVDLDAAEHNFWEIKNKLSSSTMLCCVVKANAYGHGAVQLSKLYEELGADYLAVSNIEEAIQLRKADIRIPVLILGYTDPRCAIDLAKNDITQCVFSCDYGKALSDNALKENVRVRVHIKVDTGMGRIGFRCERHELESAAYVCNLPGLQSEGIFTHFASADEGNSGRKYTLGQLNKFLNAIRYLEVKGVKFELRHCANSAGIFDFPESHLDMVRAGIVLYGLQPSKNLKNPCDLTTILTLKTIIDHIKTVHPGDYIGYGRKFRAKHSMKVATIPIGYADGLWRSNFQHNTVVNVNGKNAPIIGRVCMDQCMIDITDIPSAAVNSKVTVYGAYGETSIDHIASANGTINYEIICAIGERVPRVYRRNGQIVAVADNIV